jgi:dipeptidyl aminopeptidase/acylaminoacyl peptidase
MPAPNDTSDPQSRPPKTRETPERPFHRTGPGARESGFDLESLLRLPSLLWPKVSWRRNRFAYFWDGTGRTELYLKSTDRDDARQLSHGEVPKSVRWRPTWDRADRSLAFARDRDGNERYELFRIDTEDSSVRQITAESGESYPLEFSPDNRWILTLSNMAGRGGRSQLNLWRVPAEGGPPEQLTDYASPVAIGGYGLATWSPDGRQVAYGANGTKNTQNQDVYLCDADGSNAHRVFRGRLGSRDGVSAWHPAGGKLAISSDAAGRYRPGVLDLRTERVTWLGEGRIDESPAEFSPDGRSLLTFLRDGVRVVPRLYSVASRRGVGVPIDGGTLIDAEFAADGKSLLAFHQSPVRRAEFSRLRPGRRPEALLPAAYGSVNRTLFVDPRTVRYRTFDGRLIEALLYVPKARRRSRLPALVEVHGGPTWQFTRDFDPIAQYIVSRGFVVLRPNVRGSTGYGPEFQDLNRYDWGGGDLKDVVAGAQFAARLPTVDPKRLGIWGESYGGFMTYLATVKEPDLWRAACAWVGITDLEQLYQESREHYRYMLRHNMGDPIKNRKLWRDRSAIHFAQRLKATLLIVHGANDPRCPIDQAQRYRDRLLQLGRHEGEDFEYVELGAEGHGSSDIEQKLRTARIVTEFFERTLAGGSRPLAAAGNRGRAPGR